MHWAGPSIEDGEDQSPLIGGIDVEPGHVDQPTELVPGANRDEGDCLLGHCDPLLGQNKAELTGRDREALTRGELSLRLVAGIIRLAGRRDINLRPNAEAIGGPIDALGIIVGDQRA